MPLKSRYSILNVKGVQDAMKLPTGTRKFDNEKRDRAVARAILDKLGLEPEKYRLGYTKVSALKPGQMGQVKRSGLACFGSMHKTNRIRNLYIFLHFTQVSKILQGQFNVFKIIIEKISLPVPKVDID